MLNGSSTLDRDEGLSRPRPTPLSGIWAEQQIRLLAIVILQRFHPFPPSPANPETLAEKTEVILSIERPYNAPLAEIGKALRRGRLALSLSESRQQERRQNGDDGNYHQQFDQSETTEKMSKRDVARFAMRSSVEVKKESAHML